MLFVVLKTFIVIYYHKMHLFANNKKQNALDCHLNRSVSMVAGMGFEPHDLRVITKVPFAVHDFCLRRINLLDICRPLHSSTPSLYPPLAAVRLDSQRATLVGLIHFSKEKTVVNDCLFGCGDGI